MTRLQKLYRQYNRKYFGGQLPKNLKVHYSTELPGWGRTVREGRILRIRDGKTINTISFPYFEILISPKIRQWGLQGIGTTLLHEMAHVDLQLQGKRHQHGKVFIKRMRELVAAGAYDKLF